MSEHPGRRIQCPVCGYQIRTYGIGAVHCGPHRRPSGELTPAVPMREIDRAALKAEGGDR